MDTSKHAGAPVPRSESRTDRVLALVRDAAIISWTLDAEGRLTDGGEWTAFTGQPRSHLENEGWLEMVHVEDRERTSAIWAMALGMGQPCNTECRIRSEDGAYRWFNTRATPMRRRDGAIERWVGVCLEIPETWRFGEDPTIVSPISINVATIDAPIVRAARAMLDWSAVDLSDRSGVSVSTIRRLENAESEIQSRRTSTARLLAVFQREGLRFLDQNGVVIGVGWAESATAAG